MSPAYHKIMIVAGTIVIFLFSPTLTSSLGLEEVTYPQDKGKSCDPNVPKYSQIGCTEKTNESSQSYSPSISTTPYTLPSEGPAWNAPIKQEADTGDPETTTEIDLDGLLTYVQETLRDIPAIASMIDKQSASLKFFSVDPKQLKSEVSKQRSGFQDLEQLIKDGDSDTAEEKLEELDDFVSETFIEVLTVVRTMHDTIETLPSKEVQTLLRRAFKPIREPLMNGETSTTHELLEVYVENLKKNKKLYAIKKLTAKSRKNVTDAVNGLRKELTATLKEIKAAPVKEEKVEVTDEKEQSAQKKEIEKTIEQKREVKKIEPIIIEEAKKVEVKTPVQSDVYKRINEGIQKQTQFDSWSKVYNLGSGIR